jgi:hypothetical protein
MMNALIVEFVIRALELVTALIQMVMSMPVLMATAALGTAEIAGM